jgi:hypothetical protein
MPSEQSVFSSCINNPPGYEGGSEYGLVNAKEAVSKHLPRAANDPAKIRTGAQLVIIVATDEVPNETYDPPASLSYSDYSTCQLSASKQAGLDQLIKPYMDYFNGVTDPEAKLNFFQTIGGTCGNTCNADVAHGYKELAKAFNGDVYDVCASNLNTSINTIINDIQAASGGVTLTGKPVAASLALAVDGVIVQRSLLSGFNYDSITKLVTFSGPATIKKGSAVVATFKTWQ